ncbi:MAG: beta-lactamase family protein [Acidimicrobiia bacterium]|nr:beta-lactamase family protein [Acidimicrobiia bacterium]
MEGHAHPDFEAVAGTFRHQLARTSGGAALAVFHEDELVVDLWGGLRTEEEPWDADTLAMCFSTTKGIASTALHVLADRGEVRYDAAVSDYWPEFAQAGKEKTTVRHILTHSAGLHRIRSVIDHADDMLDWDHMTDALARAAPAYEPGTATGYHAMTYGWLVGEIVRRVSGKPVDVFVADEIARPLGLDGLYVGCPESERHRVAPLGPIGVPTHVGPRPLRQLERRLGEVFARFLSFVRSPVNPRRIVNALAPRGIEDFFLGSGLMDASIPAANGFMTARSLGRMYAMLAGQGTTGGVQLLSPATVRQVGRVQVVRIDRVMVLPMMWRLGYHGIMTIRGYVPTAFGHFGFGGSGGWADPTRRLAIAMVCNRGTGTPVGDLRLLQLGAAAIACADGRRTSDDIREAS